MRESQQIRFKVGYSEAPDGAPAEFYEAAVPGAVQLDWAKAKGKGAYWFGENWRDYGFAEDMYWHYTAEIFVEDRAGKKPFLSLKGVDYAFDVKIDGEKIFGQEGMFTPAYLSLERWAGTNCALEITVHPAPKNPKRKAGTSREADLCCKPAFNYGWDWAPRLISLGLWDEAFIEYAPETMLESVEIQTELSDDLTAGTVCAAVCVSKPCGKVRLALLDAQGKTVAETTAAAEAECGLAVQLESPRLWWCAGQGEPYCYTVKASLLDKDGRITDEASRLTGFRRAKLVINAGAYDTDEVGYPSTQSAFPMTLELNGRAVFAKGSNWIPPELFAGLTGPKTFEPLVRLAKEAHMNIFRMWGGGYINKECFYEMCDHAGIMIWQEFPLACNCYPDTDAYLNVLDRESVSIIKRLRTHPCLCIWSGGNELFNYWSKMTNQSRPLRLLDKNCYDHDRKTPFIFTSPLYGAAHGGYTFMDIKGEELIGSFIGNKDKIAFTEFGCPGAAAPDYVKAIMTEDEFRDTDAPPWYSHHAFNAWLFHETWLNPGNVRYFFGDTGGTEALLERSHILQSYGYKHLFEEARRQWPRVSMAVNWCFNEPWPCIANNSLISWPARARAAYYTVRDSLRDRMLSVRLRRLRWQTGEAMPLDVYLFNHAPSELPAGGMTLYLLRGGEKIRLAAFDWEIVGPNEVLALGSAQADLSGLQAGEYRISAEAQGHPEFDSVYGFFVRPEPPCPEKERLR